MSEITQSARLLLVDDEVANLCLLQNILNRIGYRHLESVTDSRDVFDVIANFRPDLLILDLNMPHIDGYTIMQQLGKGPDEYLPVLVLTADATPQAKRRALAAGASDLLTKPFDTSEAIMRIRNLLELRSMHGLLRRQNQSLEETVIERTRELRDMQRQMIAQERLRAFGEMAGGIVHDFNNALMSVIGYSEILLQDEAMLTDTATVKQFLQIMNTAGRDASHVVGRLREFYRPREATDVFAPVDLNKLLEEVMAITQPKWRDQALAAGRVVKLEFDLAKVPAITGDAAELREVATNLIFNAVDAMPDGGVITLRTRHDGARVVWEVADSGVGMSETVRTRCLEPFFSTKGEKGTGLGLSMVFGIVKRHEGTLDIESGQGTGTTFRMTFPGVVDAFQSEQNSAPKIARQLDVLVVDDEPVTRDVLSTYLAADGHRVVTAANGPEALECCANRHFDLMLTDHGMPGMNGLQLATATRQRHPQQPIILVTGFSDPGLNPTDQPDSVNLVLLKPVPHSDLRRAMNEVLGNAA